MTNTPTKILLDCDPGIDDALAILLALASPEVELVGVTTVGGNSLVENETKNALAVLELAGGARVPVAQGSPRGLLKDLTTAADTHGLAGLGYAQLPVPMQKAIDTHAVDFIIDTILSQPGEITLIPTGPLTNIALAVRKEPRIVPAVRECIIMGGAFRHEGNMPLAGEYNIWCDPHAARIVFHAGLPITLVPLDVTYQCLFTDAHMVDLRVAIQNPKSPVIPVPILGTRNGIGEKIQNFIDDATRFYIEYHRTVQNIDGCAINDALALALAFMPDLVTTRELFVDVETGDGPGHAGTFADFWKLTPNPPNMKVALQVDAPRFMEMFVERMAALARQF
jgi:purine nucleosidase